MQKIALALLLTLGLAGCGSESTEVQTSTDQTPIAAEPTRFSPRVRVGINPANGQMVTAVEVAPGVGIDPGSGHMIVMMP